MRQPAVYTMANGRNGTLYTGVTSNLPQRAWLHRAGNVAGFTKQHGCTMLVWYETHATMPNAIAREKQIKGGSRQKKLALI
jgi:putative endonuclease